MNLFRSIRFMNLNKKLWMFAIIIAIPFIILMAYLIQTLNGFYSLYTQTVENIRVANQYYVDLKENVDYSLYKITVKSETFESAKHSPDIYDPYELIDGARVAFIELESTSNGDNNRQRLVYILKSFDLLEMQIDKVPDNLENLGYYANMDYLDTNIRSMTQTIKNSIQEYIYVEATSFVNDDLRYRIESSLQMILLSLALIIGLVLFAIAFITNSITKPIRKLCDATELVAKGDFSTRADTGAADEISILTRSFNSMTEEIGYLVEDITKEQKNLRATELKLLQAQINPHFLYNTLDSIIWLVEGGQRDPAVSMVTSLSDFFRITLSEGQDFISIQEEEIHIRSYLEIQHYRYRDILDYEIDIPKELYHYTIIKLTLQPLVENALYHGIKNKREKGQITVTGAKVGDDLIFEVFDNGIGIHEEKLKRLRREMNDEAEDMKSGFGLVNVAQRIRLNYGAEYGVSVNSVLGEWTKFTVKVPANMRN